MSNGTMIIILVVLLIIGVGFIMSKEISKETIDQTKVKSTEPYSYNFGFPSHNSLNRSRFGVTARNYGILNPWIEQPFRSPYDHYNSYAWSYNPMRYNRRYNPFLDRPLLDAQIDDDFDCYPLPENGHCVRGFSRVGRQCCRQIERNGYF